MRPGGSVAGGTSAVGAGARGEKERETTDRRLKRNREITCGALCVCMCACVWQKEKKAHRVRRSVGSGIYAMRY